jgi:hypothetical protein
MIGRLEVLPGAGTVARFGNVAVWAGPTASPGLLEFLVESARNVGPSATGGHDIAEHVAGVLRDRLPEPGVPFATAGPGADNPVVLLHGPIQLWDGTRWLRTDGAPGWRVVEMGRVTTLLITPRGASLPPAATGSAPTGAVLDLTAGVVPGGGLALVLTQSPVLSQSPVLTQSSDLVPPPGPAPAPGPTPASVPTPAPTPDPALDENPAPTDLPPGPGPAWLVPPEGPDHTPAEVLDGPPSEPTEAPPSEPTEPSPSEPTEGPPTGPQHDPPTGPSQWSGPLRHPVDLRQLGPAPVSPLPPGDAVDTAAADAVTVSGLACPQGHLNHPRAPTCLCCGLPLDGAGVTARGPRPPLGILIGSDNRLWRVDGSYLIGSAPDTDPSVRSGGARPLVLAGDDRVAPVHAELRASEWALSVVDRDTVAGTFVLRPGDDQWVAVPPSQAVPLTPGSHLAVGSTVLTFSSPWPR